MGDSVPTGKVVDFTATRDGATKGKPPKKAAAPDKGKQADKAKDAAKPRRGRPARADKAAPTRPSRNLGTKCPKANRLPGKALPLRRRPRLQPSKRPPLGMPPIAGKRRLRIPILPCLTRAKVRPPVSGRMQRERQLLIPHIPHEISYVKLRATKIRKF